MKRQKKEKIILFICLLFMIAAAMISFCVGASGMSLSQLWGAIMGGPAQSAASRIFWFVRLPRTLACLAAGAGLAVSGSIVQIVLSNQLASPSIIGVNAGAGLAVTICSALGVVSGWAVAGASFVGALAAVLLVVFAAKKSGASKTTVVLGGIAVGACINAVTEAINTMVPEAAIAHADFRVGGFSSVNSERLLPVLIIIAAGVIIACSMANFFDVLSLGDDTAKSLGMSAEKVRNAAIILAALLAGTAVSAAGLLGFVGLIIPHVGRRIIGNNSVWLIPGSAFLGAGFVTLCDLLSRIIFQPYELPTGILLSFIGGPFFVWLLIKRKGNHK